MLLGPSSAGSDPLIAGNAHEGSRPVGAGCCAASESTDTKEATRTKTYRFMRFSTSKVRSSKFKVQSNLLTYFQLCTLTLPSFRSNLKREPEPDLRRAVLSDGRKQIGLTALDRVDREVVAIEHVEHLGDRVDSDASALQRNVLLDADVGSILRRLDVVVARDDRPIGPQALAEVAVGDAHVATIARCAANASTQIVERAHLEPVGNFPDAGEHHPVALVARCQP